MGRRCRVVSDDPFRTEQDALGEVRVPTQVLYGAHTVRAVKNFSVSGLALGDRPGFVTALAHVKAAAARANAMAGVVAPEIAEAIVQAARTVTGGRHHDQFPTPLVQGGGGTAINMNVNEVLANIAEESLGGLRGVYSLVHPIDHVNRSQSTNDVIPTAVAIATYVAGRQTVSRLGLLAHSFIARSLEYEGKEHLGRTCLQDAVALPISATHRSQAHAILRTAEALDASLGRLLEVPLGATAVGTGIGSPHDYQDYVIETLAQETALSIRRADDLFDALANIDTFVDVAAQLLRAALVVEKIARDLRLLASGPSGGIAEIILPTVQVGSSIMPGKSNPVIPELVLQVAVEVRGTATIVAAAAAAGELELNMMEPVVARHLPDTLEAFGRAVELFATRCVDGLRWNMNAVTQNLRGSLSAVVTDAAQFGYSSVSRRLGSD